MGHADDDQKKLPICPLPRRLSGAITVWSIALGTLLIGNAQAAPAVTSVADPVNLEYVNTWIAEAKGCENIRNYARPNVIRFSVEAILACQALKLGGYDGEYKLVPAPNYTRAMLMAANGEATMPTETLWAEDLDEKKFYATKPLLADGEIIFGAFVKADKLKSYNVKTLADLKKLKAVTSRNWVKDWGTLTGMGVNTLDASSLESIYKMVGADRAQFTLWSFNALPSFEVTVESVTLAPLPGIKIVMRGERRLAVSRAAPNGKEVFEALNKGIEILRANGTIARAWRESGYINKRTDSWVALN
jgi:hypothetical protein